MISEFFRKAKEERERRNKAYWKMKQLDRIEYFNHAEWIRKGYGEQNNTIFLTLKVLATSFSLWIFLIIMIAAFPEQKEKFLNIILCTARPFAFIVFISLICGFAIDLHMFIKRRRYFEKLNKRFKLI